MADRRCKHLIKYGDDGARRAHTSVLMRANNERSRSELDDTTYLCEICSAMLIIHLQELEASS